MINKDPIVTEKVYVGSSIHRICWSAIFAGAFVGLGLGFLLHLYGVAISLSAYSSTSQGASVIAIGGFLGMLLGVIAAMAAAGFVAGYLGRFHYYPLPGGVIYGFVTWSLIIFLSALMIGPMSHYVTIYGDSLSNTATMEIAGGNKTTTPSSNTPAVTHQQSDTNPAVNVTTKQLAWGGWIIFVLFFVGALSSCIGACCGIQCKRENCLNPPPQL